jgi:hypothetical protein
VPRQVYTQTGARLTSGMLVIEGSFQVNNPGGDA